MPPRLLTRENTALLIIDVQEKLYAVMHDKEKILGNILKLIDFAKIMGLPIILTEQYPKGLGRTIKQIKDKIPETAPLEKTAFNCFGAEGFKELLQKNKITTLIITGIETHVCVSQTALDAIDKSITACVISDATTSRTKENWHVGLERMRDNGTIISSTEMVMYELLKDAKNPEFKQAQPLLK
ncbi:MAG: hydrolase [Candidatus Jordarchaeaceae archaeon]